MRQDVGGAERDDAEPGGGAHQAVGDFGDSAVAAGGDDHLLAAPGRLAGQSFGMAGAMGFGQIKPDAIGDQHIQHPPQQMRTAAAGDGIEDNHHGARIGSRSADGLKERLAATGLDVISMTVQ